MDISSVNSDLIRGNVTTIILGSLWSQDRYGYDILKEIELKSEGQYKLKQPTLYNQLKRLEKQGLISSYEGDPEDTGGGRRRYYSLTAEGRSFLQKEKSEYEYSRTILDKLVSSRQFDFDRMPAPFNTDDLRPYTKKDNSEKAKVVYKEKEVEKVVLQKIYFDASGNEITEEEAERLAAEGKNTVAADAEELAAEKARREELERLELERAEEIERLKAERERAEAEKREELERIEREKEAELNRIAEEHRAEVERLAEEKRRAEEELAAKKAAFEEAYREEIARIEREKETELNRIAEEHRAEVERLAEEKRRSEEELAAKQAAFETEREEELNKLEEERRAAELRFAEEKARFEAEKRFEEERRAENERIERERKEELERIERARIAAEEKFAAEQARFLEEKRAEEARREEAERLERERAEEQARIAREREEALKSQATMSLDDVFKELDAKSEYTENRIDGDKLFVDSAVWHVAQPVYYVPAEKLPENAQNVREAATGEADTPSLDASTSPEESLAEEPTREKAPDETVPTETADVFRADATADNADERTATLEEIFAKLNARSEYTDDADKNKTFIVDEASWQTEKVNTAVNAQTETDEIEKNVRAAELADTEAARKDELLRLEAERKAELQRIADELAAVKARLDGETARRSETADYERNASENARTANAFYYSADSYGVRENHTDAERDADCHAAAGTNGSARSTRATMDDLFRTLDEKEAEIDSKNASETAFADKETSETRYAENNDGNTYTEAAADYAETAVGGEYAVRGSSAADKGEFVTSAVRSSRSEAFEYEKHDVNYKEFFSSIADVREEKPLPAEEERKPLPKAETDLKSRLYAEGFKMRPYDRGNTSEYYTFNFVQSNRLNRDAWLIVMAIYLVEAAIMWASTARQISYVYFLPVMLGGAALMLIPTFVYLANPTRRKRADFNFKLSLINRAMLMIEIAVVLILVAFFAVGVSVNDTVLIMETMAFPIILLTNLPVSALVYWLLYRSKKYHTA